MKIKTRYIILIALFVLYFGTRVYFALQTDYFSDDYSYFVLRQVDHITKTGMPLINDDLSYGGRTYVFMPLYFYILTFFTLFFPKIIVIKIINNFFASTLILGVYLVCSIVVKNRKISLICSILAASIPAYINATLNNVSTYSLIVPGSFFLLYLFLNLEKEKDVLNLLIFLTLIVVLSSASTILIILGILIFIILSYLENVPLKKIELEYTAFFVFFFLWTNFIIFKEAFQKHGLSIIWSNIPPSIVTSYFANINIVQAVSSIGFLPFIFGTYTTYNYLLKKKSKNVSLFITLFLSTFLLFILKLIQTDLAFAMMGTSLVVLFGRFLRDLFSVIKKTKFAKLTNWVYMIVILLLLLTQFVPGLILMTENINKSHDKNYINGFIWFKKNTKKNSVILAIPEEGNLITYFGERKNIIDTEFILIDDVEVRHNDINAVFTHKFKIEAIRILEKYNVDYIVFSNRTKEKYSIEEIAYIHDECFDLVLNETIQIYKINKELCVVKEL